MKLDLMKDGINEIAENVHIKTSDFHENYVTKITPDCGKYGDEAKFVAEMVPGVSEYNAIREGDWKAFAIAAGIDGAAIAAGLFTAGTGYAAVKGGTAAAKAGLKVATKEVAEAGIKKVAKETAEAGVEKAVKETAEAGVEKIAKESAENATGVVRKESLEQMPEGGNYKDVKRLCDGETHEVHHMPADSASFLDTKDGPAIRMEKLDHQKTASWGNTIEAREYRKIQQELIEKGKFREAIEMDIKDITDKFPGKYDNAIKEMLEYVDKLELEGII